MGKLIATTQATVDGVDPVGEWVQADGDHSDYSFERQARSSGLVLGRKTYEGLADTGRVNRAAVVSSPRQAHSVCGTMKRMSEPAPGK